MPEKVPPFPKSDDRELAYRVARTAIGTVPLAGGALRELAETLIGSPLQKRRNAWFERLGEALNELSEKIADRNLAEDQEFLSAVYEATHVAMKTHREEKLRALQNLVANVALGLHLDEVVRGRFMGYVERFSPAHLAMLHLLREPMRSGRVAAAINGLMSGALSHVLKAAMPEIGITDERAIEVIYEELQRERLVDGTLNAMSTPEGLRNKRTTPLGDSFLRFIAAPS